MRIDRFLVLKGIGSRKEVQKILKKGLILVNEEVIKDPKYKISEDDVITFDEYEFIYNEFKYFILNKPKDCVSATVDNLHKTVIDLLVDEDYQTDIFPVGRLDIDTTGFLLLTNDGDLSHRLLSPKKHVDKVYEVTIKTPLTDNDIKRLSSGVLILDDYKTKPATVNVISDNIIHLTISEGKFHQVKEMLKAVDNEVVQLKRIKFGNVDLPSDLELGDYISVSGSMFK